MHINRQITPVPDLHNHLQKRLFLLPFKTKIAVIRVRLFTEFTNCPAIHKHAGDDLGVVVELEFVEGVLDIVVFVAGPGLVKEVGVFSSQNVIRGALIFWEYLFGNVRGDFEYGSQHLKYPLLNLPHSMRLLHQQQPLLSDMLLCRTNNISRSYLRLRDLEHENILTSLMVTTKRRQLTIPT